MCGILAIVNRDTVYTEKLIEANQIVAHRGPDDEGYLLWRNVDGVKLLLGSNSAKSTRLAYNYQHISPGERNWTVGFGHKRLSIIDLSAGGHQPMALPEAGLSITYNGEIYNYLELRDELKSAGCAFQTDSDTEVIIQAWATWGEQALHKFNGMFAFVILDTKKMKLFAVRDRFGVKPLYYTDQRGYLAFASEVKQLRVLPEYKFSLNKTIAFDYLRYGVVDQSEHTFELGINQLSPGHLIEVDLNTGQWKKTRWYELKPVKWQGDEQGAIEQLQFLLKDSVRLRMRSDVLVGSALSGGLDSSTIVCLMNEVLLDHDKGNHLIKTITSCQEDKKYDEWEYASEVINKVKADPYQVFPSFEKLLHDLDKMMWHMDYPFGSTSQFSQWCVFEEAKKLGLTVMIDGQGADEQLAGYGGNDMALYTGLLGKGRFLKFVLEARSYKKQKGRWPTGFLLGAVQTNFRWLLPFFPPRYRIISDQYSLPDWLNTGHLLEKKDHPKSLGENLFRQVMYSPLPSLLRYEDRNSMAFSIESRVPFMDFRLIEFTLGLPEEFIYPKGQRKHILRRAFIGRVPDKILSRTDKMGFMSAEERWLKKDGKDWFENEIGKANSISDFINETEAMTLLANIQNGTRQFDFEPWRILCLHRFLKSM